MSEATLKRLHQPKWIITTKLAFPKLPRWCIEREKALENLDRVFACRLGFVHAPPGYGKTTLLAQWLKRNSNRDVATAWLTLDEDDREPGMFLTYLAASLTTANIPVTNLSSVLSDGFMGISPIIAVNALVNDLGKLDQDAIIILDDFHQVRDSEIGKLLNRLITHIPDRCHLVIAGRENSDLKLAGINAYGQMVTMNADDLRFSALETQAFYHGNSSRNISDHNAELLAQRTEGWVLALQLAGVRRQRIPDLRRPDLRDTFRSSGLWLSGLLSIV